MQFGVSTHLYHDARLDRDHLVEIAAHGFSAVEIFATRTHVDYHDAQTLAELSEHLRDTVATRAQSMHAPSKLARRGRGPVTRGHDRQGRTARRPDESLVALRAARQREVGFLVLQS